MVRLAPVLLLFAGIAASASFARPASAARSHVPVGPLAQGSGPVMHKVAAYTIFWLPKGTSFEPSGSSTTDTDYENVVNNFFLDVGGSDWYSVLTQYGDKKGPIQNQVSLVDSVVDTRAYPKNRGSQDNPLLDSDIQKEITREIKARHWTNQKLVSHFFVFTADNVQSCDGNDPSSSDVTCTFDAQNGYCGYHSFFTYLKKPLVYTNGPDLFDQDTCDANDPTTPDNSPSGDLAADIQVNNVAHELAEASTDPLGNAWGNGGDSEVGDLCNTAFPARDGYGGDLSFSNNDEYYIQSLYSNQDGGCVMAPGGDLIPNS